MKLLFFIYLLTFGDVIGSKTEVAVKIIGRVDGILIRKWQLIEIDQLSKYQS